MSTQLYPDILDASAVIATQTQPIYLPIGVEGQGDNDGTGTAGVLYTIITTSDAVTYFGVASPLTKVINEVLKRGAGPVLAVMSKKGTAPVLADRQGVWDNLSSDPSVRIRLTDSTVQADLVALGTSCTQAELVQHKQFAIVGVAAGVTKANLITTAAALANKRVCLVAPGVYNESAALISGSLAAAAVAAEVAKNSDPSNDLDLWKIPYLTGIEKDVNGYPIFREKVSGGTAVNDFEDLLQGGVSPLQPSLAPGGVETSHLRMAYITDTTYDALSTRIIVDQVFVDVRDYLRSMNFLRTGNTAANRQRMVAGVSNLLLQRQDWIAPITQADGTPGYNVSATPSPDMKQVTVGYSGVIVRGIQTIRIAANLLITV